MQIKFETKVDRSETLAERAANFQRGDVIEIRPDEHVWPNEDLAPGTTRIFRLPALTEYEANFWVAPEKDPSGLESQFLQRRQQRLNLRAMPTDLRHWLEDDSRSEPVKVAPFTGNDLMAFGYRVQPLLVE